MPLPPLTDPTSPGLRARKLAVALPASSFLFGSLLAFNAAQTASLLVKPLSPRAFRGFNRWTADTWWGWCVTGSRLLHAIEIQVSGDLVPSRENAIVIANHQQMPDITFLMMWAREKERLGDLKWIVKDALKLVPGVGWGMVFLDCVFVKRDWTRDRASVERAFEHLVRNRVPLWLISFPEGTRITPEKLEGARAHALERGLTPPRHVLVPRTKGFVASVQALRGHVAAVYDVTIGYEKGVPTLWQYIKGYAPRAHLHVRRFPITELPDEDGALATWLLDRFVEKDQLLEDYYREGSFRGGSSSPPHLR